MYNILFLDDDINRYKFFKTYFPNAKCVETAETCISELVNQDWDIVFLDHDLGNKVLVNEKEANTGSEVVRWIKKNKPNVKLFILHSLNFPARENMASNLRDNKYEVLEIPFIQMSTIFKKEDEFEMFQKNIKEKLEKIF